MFDPVLSADYCSSLSAAGSAMLRARRVLAITGAGLSADSGLPTYRGVGGLYDGGSTDDGVSIEAALSGAMLRQRPELTWKHLLQIARACTGVAANEGHLALAAMQQHFEQFTVLTQNVDGLHRMAGSDDLIEIHGDLSRLHCESCGYQADSPAALTEIPICPCCAASLRPSIVLFGEALPHAALQRLDAVLAAGVDLVLVIGTSACFPYIAGPVAEAARAGLATIEINPERSEVSYLVRHRLSMRAAEALPKLLRLIEQGRQPLLPAY